MRDFGQSLFFLWMKRGCGIVALSLVWLLSVILLQLRSSVWRTTLLLLGSIALIIQSGEGYALLSDFHTVVFISFLCLPISACRGHDVPHDNTRIVIAIVRNYKFPCDK